MKKNINNIMSSIIIFLLGVILGLLLEKLI